MFTKICACVYQNLCVCCLLKAVHVCVYQKLFVSCVCLPKVVCACMYVCVCCLTVNPACHRHSLSHDVVTLCFREWAETHIWSVWILFIAFTNCAYYIDCIYIYTLVYIVVKVGEASMTHIHDTMIVFWNYEYMYRVCMCVWVSEETGRPMRRQERKISYLVFSRAPFYQLCTSYSVCVKHKNKSVWNYPKPYIFSVPA